MLLPLSCTLSCTIRLYFPVYFSGAAVPATPASFLPAYQSDYILWSMMTILVLFLLGCYVAFRMVVRERDARLHQLQKLHEAEKKRATLELKQKISRDLHDELSNALAGLRYYVNDLRLRSTNTDEQTMLLQIEEEVNHVYRQAREYMHNLEQGFEGNAADLGKSLRSLSEYFSNTAGLRLHILCNIEELEARLFPEQQAELDLIVKEAIANSMKHASATELSIRIGFTESQCVFSITDNGKGFTALTDEKGMGLKSMTERVKRLEGRLTIRAVNPGTQVEGSFPVLPRR